MKFARHSLIAFHDEAREGRVSLAGDEEMWALAPEPPVALAKAVAALALRRLDAGETERPEDLRAIYVRPSDAELKERCREQRPLSG